MGRWPIRSCGAIADGYRNRHRSPVSGFGPEPEVVEEMAAAPILLRSIGCVISMAMVGR
jgi:hypothetical protein